MRALLVFLIALVAVAAVVVGVLYVVLQAHSLPHFIPGYAAGNTGKHSKRGYLCFGIGAVCLIAALLIGMVGHPKRHGSLR
jgi:hypothetical protein